MGDRPRHRRRRARCDPARRLPGSLSRPRRRRERPDAGARREAAHPGGHARHARREPVHVRADDAPAEGGRGRARSPIRRTSAVAQRPRTSSPDTQLTATDFAASDTASVDSQITGTQRAFAISIDGVHGVSFAGACPATRSTSTSSVAGDVKLFRPNVKVLTTPTLPGPAGGGNLVLRIETKDAAKWLYAADNTQF